MTKKKKPRSIPVKLEPQPGWNLGRHVTITLTNGARVPRFLAEMIVKTKQGGEQ